MRPFKPQTDTLSHPENVLHDRTAGSPTGREPYGDGAPILVGGATPTHGGWENQLQGKGGQGLLLARRREVCECREPNDSPSYARENPVNEVLESRMTLTCHVRFGGGLLEKYQVSEGYMATRQLPTQQRTPYVILITSFMTVLRDRLRGASPMVTEPP